MAIRFRQKSSIGRLAVRPPPPKRAPAPSVAPAPAPEIAVAPPSKIEVPELQLTSPKEDAYIASHLHRMDSLVFPDVAETTLSGWIQKNTTLAGELFSFKDHEYQEYLLALQALTLYIQKPSQCGCSELQVRWVLAYLYLHRAVNAIYILPTSRFAEKFSQTRCAPVIRESPLLKASVGEVGVDSTSIKEFANGSFLYFQGASKSSQAISVPARLLLIDERNFVEDEDVLTTYTSRLTHATTEDPALERIFSTPTHANHGVSAGLSTSKRHIYMQKCQRCNHHFVPDYYKNVVLPKFKGSLREIGYYNKAVLEKYDADTAFLQCPKCRRKVDQFILKNRQFVIENTESKSDSVGVAVTPFCVPKYSPPSKLIRLSTKYKRHIDFVNFGLGLPCSDELSGLLEAEAEEMFDPNAHSNYSNALYPCPPLTQPPYQITGCDLGGTCAFLSAYPAPNGHLRIISAREIPRHQMVERYPMYLGETRAIASVMDALPYTDLVAQFQGTVPSLWAAIKTDTKSTELFHIREQEEDETKATYGLRQISFKRNALFDHVLMMIRNRQISFAPTEENMRLRETLVAHFTDMRRKLELNRHGEEEYKWVKSATGADHFWHALGFLVLATYLRGLSGCSSPAPFLVTSIKLKNPV